MDSQGHVGLSEWDGRTGAQITALTDLGPAAQPSLDRLHHALGGTDAADLLPLLADTHGHLPADHAALADRITAVVGDTEQVRRTTRHERTRRREGQDQP